MTFRIGRVLVAVGLLTGIGSLAIADSSGIETKPDRIFIHTDSGIRVTVPPEWKIHTPHKLRKMGTTSVLSIEKSVVDPVATNAVASGKIGKGEKDVYKDDRRAVVTIYWNPLDLPTGNREMKDLVRVPPSDGISGSEYDVLATIYGKKNVMLPVVVEIGKFQMFKIVINDGPDKDALNMGYVYLFEAKAPDGKRWLLKVRATFPKARMTEFTGAIEEVLRNIAASS